MRGILDSMPARICKHGFLVPARSVLSSKKTLLFQFFYFLLLLFLGFFFPLFVFGFVLVLRYPTPSNSPTDGFVRYTLQDLRQKEAQSLVSQESLGKRGTNTLKVDSSSLLLGLIVASGCPDSERVRSV